MRNQHYAQGLNDQLTETSFTVAQKMHHWQISKANWGDCAGQPTWESLGDEVESIF